MNDFGVHIKTGPTPLPTLDGAGELDKPFAGVDIQDLILMVQLNRTKQIDDQVRGQMADMMDRNEKIKALNDIMDELRKACPKDEKGTAKIPDAVAAELKKWGIDVDPSKEYSKKDFDVFIGSVKTKTDNLNTTGQMDMIRLQSLMDKRNQSFDMMTNTLSKFSKSLDSIIGNLR